MVIYSPREKTGTSHLRFSNFDLNGTLLAVSDFPFSLSRWLTRVVEKVDNAIHRINHSPADSAVCFVNTYPLDNDLSAGLHGDFY